MSAVYDPKFRSYATSVRKAIAAYGNDDSDFTLLQKEQVEALVEGERAFRARIIELGAGPFVYETFIKYITEDRRNILAARPFFRERQEIFDEEISDIIRERDFESLYRFDFNWQFVQFVLSLDHELLEDDKLKALAKRVSDARHELITTNLPLAISRAKLFCSKMPESHHEFMDFIQIASEGLIAAVDKFVLPYSTVFRSVIIGRVSGNFIKEYSETFIHFYPSDRRKLYRANASLRKVEPDDYEALAAVVNKGMEDNPTTPSELQHLLSAATLVSADSIPPNHDEDGHVEAPINAYPADESWQPDKQVEDAEMLHKLSDAMQTLTIFERKLLAMKGVTLDV